VCVLFFLFYNLFESLDYRVGFYHYLGKVWHLRNFTSHVIKTLRYPIWHVALILGNQAGYYRWIDKFRHDPTAFVCLYDACLTFRSSPSLCECSCTAYFCPPAVVERNGPIFLYLEHKRYDTRYVKLRRIQTVTLLFLLLHLSFFLSRYRSISITSTTDNVSYRLIRHCLTIEMIHYLSVSTKYGETFVRTKYISCSKLL